MTRPRRSDEGDDSEACFHLIGCPVGACTWLSQRPTLFIQRGLQEVEGHLEHDHHAYVHLRQIAPLGSPCRAAVVACTIEAAVLEEGLISDGEANLRLKHVRVQTAHD